MSLLAASTSSVLAEGGVNVDLDASLFVQSALFLVLLFALKPLLFDPMLKLFEEREKQTDGTKAKARREGKKSEEALTKYEAAMEKARAAGQVERDAIRAHTVKKEAEILGAAKAEAHKTLDAGRASLQKDLTVARQELDRQADELARQIAGRALGREVQG